MIHVCVHCSFSLLASEQSATSTSTIAAADDDDDDVDIDDDIDVLTQDEFNYDEGGVSSICTSICPF